MNRKHPSAFLVIMAYIAFISLGLPDGLLGVAWPTVRAAFSRSLDSLGVMLFASMAGYLLSSSFSGKVIGRLGVGHVLALSCTATGLGLLGYTIAPYWWMMTGLSVLAGLGAGAIDAGLNTYAASHFKERLMQWLHASYGIGITLGPVIMTSGIIYMGSWRWGYIIVGSAQLILAAGFAYSAGLWENKAGEAVREDEKKLTDYRTPYSETLVHTRVWISITMFFVYTGIETTLGSWSYTFLTESRGISKELAGFWVGSYWAMFTTGRILAGFFTKRIKMQRLITYSLILALFGTILLLWSPVAGLGLAGVALTGFAIAPVFPGMVSLTESRVGSRYAANTIGMQMSSAGIGIALVPGLTGVLAQRTTLDAIPLVVILCILIMLVLHMISSKK